MWQTERFDLYQQIDLRKRIISAALIRIVDYQLQIDTQWLWESDIWNQTGRDTRVDNGHKKGG